MQLTLQMPDIYFVDYKKENLAKKIKLFTALMMYRSEQISVLIAFKLMSIMAMARVISYKKNHIEHLDFVLSPRPGE
jgi:hypothetical protein